MTIDPTIQTLPGTTPTQESTTPKQK